jgi:hypothetical protein
MGMVMVAKMQEMEAVKVLRKHHIPYSTSNVQGISTLLRRNEVDPQRLRRLGFRISRLIGNQLVVFYKGDRIGIIV